MRGLLFEIYLKNKKNIFIMNTFFMIVWIPIIFLIDTQQVAFIFFAIVVLSNSLILLLSQRKDYDLKLYKYEFMLPIKSKYIVLSKYVSQVIIITITVLILTILNYIAVKFNKEYFDFGLMDAVVLMNLLIAFIFQMISFFYLGIYRINIEKGDLWILLSTVASLGFILLEILMINKFNFSKKDGNILLMVVYLTIFCVSYFICINNRKLLKIKL